MHITGYFTMVFPFRQVKWKSLIILKIKAFPAVTRYIETIKNPHPSDADSS